MNEERQRFYDNTRQFFGRTAWSHKTYELERETWACKACFVQWSSIILTTATLTLASLSALDEIKSYQIGFWKFTIFVGSISFLVSLYQSIVNPEKKEFQVRQAAKDHLCIRNKLQILIEDTLNGEDLNKLVERRNQLLNKQQLIHQWAPDTSSSAYKKATTALKINEHLTLHDTEIDQFLPCSLKSEAVMTLSTGDKVEK